MEDYDWQEFKDWYARTRMGHDWELMDLAQKVWETEKGRDTFPYSLSVQAESDERARALVTTLCGDRNFRRCGEVRLRRMGIADIAVRPQPGDNASFRHLLGQYRLGYQMYGDYLPLDEPSRKTLVLEDGRRLDGTEGDEWTPLGERMPLYSLQWERGTLLLKPYMEGHHFHDTPYRLFDAVDTGQRGLPVRDVLPHTPISVEGHSFKDGKGGATLEMAVNGNALPSIRLTDRERDLLWRTPMTLSQERYLMESLAKAHLGEGLERYMNENVKHNIKR